MKRALHSRLRQSLNGVLLTTSMPPSSTAIPRLNRRTRNRPVRAKHATIAWQRLEPFAAAMAVIEELAGVRRHLLGGLMAALRAGESALRLHQRTCMVTIASSTASASAVPSASPFSKSSPACPIVFVTWGEAENLDAGLACESVQRGSFHLDRQHTFRSGRLDGVCCFAKRRVGGPA
jgi:hypothetical protein